MENQHVLLDNDNFDKNNTIAPQEIVSVGKFIFLSIISFGTYEIWWMYKAWKFYQQKEKLDIMPVARAIFCIFFLYALLNKIMDSAKEKGYSGSYSAGVLFAGFIGVNILSKLPDPFWLISILGFVFLIPPYNALNYAQQHSTDFEVIEQTSFSGRQIGLIIVGLAFWALVLFGLYMKL